MHTCKLCFGECLETFLDTGDLWECSSGRGTVLSESFFLGKKKTPTDTGETSAFRPWPIACGVSVVFGLSPPLFFFVVRF